MRTKEGSKIKDIAYQNKDIVSKIFAESIKEKTFSVYGVELPKIRDILPTNLPAVQANELRMDNLFLLEDDSIILVDYESSYSKEDIIDYLSYVSRILTRYAGNMEGLRIRVLILYTSDVEKANSQLDLGCLKFKIEQAFLANLNTQEILIVLQRKINAGEPLTDEEQMQLVVLPLTIKGKEKQKNLLEEVITLVGKVEDESLRSFLLAGLLTFSDKIIDQKSADQIRRGIRMLKVEKIIFEEGLGEGLKAGLKEGLRTQQLATAKKMLSAGKPLVEISEFTELSIDIIRDLQQKVRV